MLQIKKFKNIFGIKELNGAENLGRINVIYAPNGTAKSSICDAIRCIRDGEDVSDVYQIASDPSYELLINGETITENDDVDLNVVCFSGTSNFEYDETNEGLINLAVSSEIKKKVLDSKTKIDSYVADLQSIFKSVFGTDFGKKKCNDSLFYLANFDRSNEDIFVSISNLISNSTLKKLSIAIGVKDFYLFATSKVDNTVHKNDVIEKGKEYVEAVDDRLKSDIFDEKFTYFNLRNVYETALENNYFDEQGQRLLKINEIEYKEDQIKKYLTDKADEIFGSDKLSSIFEGIKKDINKNKETTSLFDFLKKNPSLFLKLGDYKNLVLSIFISLFSDNQITQIKDINRKINRELENIDTIINKKVSDTKIYEIWTKFEREFSTTKFDLKIKNRLDSFLGVSIPTFVKYSKETGEEINDPEDLRFSTGEKRTYNFINFIIEVESRNNGNPLTVIMDDAAESFDYKNKYGIIDYITALAKDNNIQLIIMTHNFDFYRSVILSLSEHDLKQFFAYRNSSGIVEFSDSAKRYYLTFSSFNQWKQNPSIEQYLSLIGFSRQIIQFQNNSEHDNVLKLDNYLHYDVDITESINFSNLCSVLSSCGINLPKGINESDQYLKLLCNTCLNICSKTISETDLEYKLVLGLGLRVFLERLVLSEYKERYGVKYSFDNPYNKANELMREAKKLFSDEDYLALTEISSINPSYIHVNSFMYEPLIDVGFEKLVELFNWLIDKNKKFAF